MKRKNLIVLVFVCLLLSFCSSCELADKAARDISAAGKTAQGVVNDSPAAPLIPHKGKINLALSIILGAVAAYQKHRRNSEDKVTKGLTNVIETAPQSQELKERIKDQFEKAGIKNKAEGYIDKLKNG